MRGGNDFLMMFSGLGGAPVPSWVVNGAHPPDLAFDLANNRAWNKATKAQSTASSLLTVSRASVGYVNDSLGNWTAIGANLPRISDLGLLVEEARTNSVRNNSTGGAVAGTPGTNPTNVAFTTAPNGLAKQIVGFGVDAFGKDYIDVRWFGTATAAQTTFASFESTTTQIAATYGQTWANSAWMSVVGGTQANIGTFNLRTSMRDSGGAPLGAVDQPITLTAVDTRFVGLATLTNPSTAFLQPQLLATTAVGPVDITIRFAWAGLENNNINATVASAVKAADGSGGVNGTAVYTLSGGTGTQATLNVTWAGGVMTVNSVASAGSYTVLPPSPATLAYVSGVATGWTGATVTLTPTNNTASAFATSPIRTTSAAATRNTDVVSAAFSGYTNAASIYGKGTPQTPVASSTVGTLAELNDSGSNNRINIRSNLGTSQPRALSVSAGTTTTLTSAGALSPGASAKLAAATAQNDQAFSANGGAVSTSAAGIAPVGLTTLYFGNIASSSQPWNGFVEYAASWASRVPNAQIQSMTT